ncbi:MAG TPA: hypothetical protein VMB25_02585 [Bryobacteraceae bacterium]|nr:hypothetical protein [Bryobacteraceae bacterium]
MYKTLWIIGLLSIYCVPLLGQNTDMEETRGLRNGRFWNTVSESAQLGLLTGMADGWEMAYRAEVQEHSVLPILAHAWVSDLTHGEISKMVTTTYQQPENLTLPIGWVVLASLAIQRGETTQGTVFPALRKFLADLMSGKAPIRFGNRDRNEPANPDFSPINVIWPPPK